MYTIHSIVIFYLYCKHAFIIYITDIGIIVSAATKHRVQTNGKNQKNVKNVLETNRNIVVVPNALVSMKTIGLVCYIFFLLHIQFNSLLIHSLIDML